MPADLYRPFVTLYDRSIASIALAFSVARIDCKLPSACNHRLFSLALEIETSQGNSEFTAKGAFGIQERLL